MAHQFEDDTSISMDTMDTDVDAKQKRRIAHATTERKRRDKTNASFQALKELVPDCSSKLILRKNDILELTVEYIHQLHHRIQVLERRGNPPQLPAHTPPFSPPVTSGYGHHHMPPYHQERYERPPPQPYTPVQLPTPSPSFAMHSRELPSPYMNAARFHTPMDIPRLPSPALPKPPSPTGPVKVDDLVWQ
ncbi:hypothetical protein EDD86DRAFT_199657 [Gorgonomyces haynaldii]|nr:hypothetical protein EDD86DRAFT_199657 [Gorgonomyces haynaldii]